MHVSAGAAGADPSCFCCSQTAFSPGFTRFSATPHLQEAFGHLHHSSSPQVAGSCEQVVRHQSSVIEGVRLMQLISCLMAAGTSGLGLGEGAVWSLPLAQSSSVPHAQSFFGHGPLEQVVRHQSSLTCGTGARSRGCAIGRKTFSPGLSPRSAYADVKDPALDLLHRALRCRLGRMSIGPRRGRLLLLCPLGGGLLRLGPFRR